MIYFYEIYSIIFFRIYFPILRLFAKGISEKIVLFEIDFIKEKSVNEKEAVHWKLLGMNVSMGRDFAPLFSFFVTDRIGTLTINDS